MEERYKVIKILNRKELLIDYGSVDGAREGDQVRIIQQGEEVFSTKNELLGTLDIVKDELEIYTVYARFSLCRKIQREKKSVIDVLDITYTKVNYLDLNVDKKAVKEKVEENVSPIAVGDIVEIIV